MSLTQNPPTAYRKLKAASSLHSRTTSTLHKITRPDKTTATFPTTALPAVHSHIDTELTRTTPPDLHIPPWETLDNPDQFVIEPRGDPSLTLADMMTRDTFDTTINSLGTGKPPGPDGIPNEIINFRPLETRSALFSLLSLLAHKGYTPP
jgi:hypothetical protein